MHPAGLPFVAGGLGLAAAGRRHPWLRNAGLAAAGACALFFRHPPRVPPTRPGVVVAPADGRVTLIDHATPPAELGLPDTPMTRVSIFLSLFDAHVQRVPVAGEVKAVEYRPASSARPTATAPARRTNATACGSARPAGSTSRSVQIAGLLARRIVCDAKTGDKLTLGETYGLIRFGSRLDTYLPAGATVLVETGQRAIGGETVLAELP